MKKIIMSIFFLSGGLIAGPISDTIGIINQLSTIIEGLLPEKQKQDLHKFTVLSKECQVIVNASENLYSEFKNIEENGKMLAKRFNCAIKTDSQLKSDRECVAISCADRAKCFAATLDSSRKLLQPIVDNMLGKVTTVTKDGKAENKIEMGVLLQATNSSLMPATQRKAATETLQSYTLLISKSLDFLQLVSLLLDPAMLKSANYTPKEQENIKSEPITVTEEVLVLK